MIALDASSPFVRVIAAVRAGEACLDDAVDVLRAIEARHGVAVHTDLGGLAGVHDQFVWRRRPGQVVLPLGELVGPPWRVTSTHEVVAARYELDRDDLDDAEYRERVFPFLTETQLLLSGMDFTNDHFVTLGEDVVVSCWSQRMWSDVLASWATASGWAARHGVSVSYVDFYAGGSLLLEGYDAFWTTAIACIRRKTIRLVGPPLPPWSQANEVQRTWKRALRAAGKDRVLAALAPAVLRALAEVRSTHIGDPKQRTRLGDPLARAAAARLAVETLVKLGPTASVELADHGQGLVPPAAQAVQAATNLVRAMKAAARFERDAMDCLILLWLARSELLDGIATEL